MLLWVVLVLGQVRVRTVDDWAHLLPNLHRTLGPAVRPRKAAAASPQLGDFP